MFFCKFSTSIKWVRINQSASLCHLWWRNRSFQDSSLFHDLTKTLWTILCFARTVFSLHVLQHSNSLCRFSLNSYNRQAQKNLWNGWHCYVEIGSLDTLIFITQFITQFNKIWTFFFLKWDWSFPVDFLMLNTNPVAKLAYHVTFWENWID